MGTGIDAARAAGADIHADVMENFRDQLIIVLLKRLADKDGRLSIPVKEVDDTGRDLVSFNMSGFGTPNVCFNFVLSKKS